MYGRRGQAAHRHFCLCLLPFAFCLFRPLASVDAMRASRFHAFFLALPLALAVAAQSCALEELSPLTSATGTGGTGGGGTGGSGTGATGGMGGMGPLLDGPCDPIVPSQCGFPFPSNVY